MSKKELRPVQLQGGVSRLHNAAQNRPRNLENCQMMINGFVRSVNDPNKITPEVSSTKPYVEWNGNVLDREGWSQEEDGTIVDGTVLDNATLNSRLYRSVQSTDSSGTTYRVVKHFANYDPDVSTNVGFQGEPGIIYDGSFVLDDLTDYNFLINHTTPAENVEADIHTSYIGIPYDKNGEAGPWFYFPVLRTIRNVEINGLALTANMVTPAEITLNCNDNTEYVEVYRSYDFNNRGFIHTGPRQLADESDGDAVFSSRQQTDNAYFYYGKYNTSVNSSTSKKEITFNDDEIWINAFMMEVLLKDSSVVSRTEVTFQLKSSNPYELISNTIRVPQTLLDVPRNWGSVHTDDVGSEDYQYHGVVGNVMSTQGDIILYGDVKYPTKRPSTGLVMFKSTIPFGNIDVQLEYIDNNGNYYYGPKETFNAVESIKFAWQGENALLIFRGGSLFERLQPNSQGVYETGFKRIPTDDEGFIAPVTYIVNADNTTTFVENTGVSVVDYITERNAVFLSASNKGMEISFDSFFLKSDEVVRGIVAARLAENESIRDYDFYVFTDKSITLYKRIGSDLRTIVPVHNVTTSFGVEQNTFTHKSGEDPTTHTLITNTRFGVAFVGTDGNVWSLIGRDLVQLDIEIPGLFLTDVRDIEYHPSEDELWVLVGPATIWVYSFIQQGWIKNYNTIYIHYNLYYNKNRKVLTSYGDEFLTLYNLDFDDDCDNIHNSPQLTTQPFGEDGVEYIIDQMEVDYITETYDDRDRDTWGILRHSVRSRKISDVEETYGSGNGNILVQYNIPSNRSIYPTLVGRGHKFKFSNFHEFRGFEIKLRKSGS